VIGVLGLALDITAREQAEKELKETSLRLNALMENLQSGVLFEDEFRQILYVNSNFCDIVGLPISPDALVGMDSRLAAAEAGKLFPDAEKLAARLEAVVKARRVVTNEELRLSDGRILECDYAPIFSSEKYNGHLWHYRDITAQKKAEEQIKIFSHAIKYSIDGVLITDLEANIFYHNDAAGRIYGYAPNELIGQNANILNASPGLSSHDIIFATRQHGSWSGELLQKRKDGAIFPIALTSSLIADETGNFLGMLGIVRDITERKQAEEKLFQTVSHLQSVLTALPDLYFRLAADGEIIDYHALQKSDLYIPPEQFLGKRVSEVLPLEIARPLQKAIAETLQTRGVVSLEYSLPMPEGKRFYEARFSSFLGRETIALIRDITERKAAEEALKAVSSRLMALMENLQSGILFENESRQILYANSKFCAMFGIPAPVGMDHRLAAQEAKKLFGEPEKFVAAIEDIVGAGVSVIGEELTLVDGRTFERDYVPILVGNEHGGHLWRYRDVTHRKVAQTQLLKYATELEKMVDERTEQIRQLEKQRLENEKLAATGRMAARVAHEINNPLGMIQTAFHLVSRAIPEEHRHYHYVGKIAKEIDRIAQIVRQMLDLHKPQQESPKLFRVDETIRDVLALMKPKFREQKITVEFDAGSSSPKITLQENMLRQIIYNLVLNALEASLPGGVIRIVAETSEQSLKMAVIDQGEGIPEDIQPQIFEPFFTTKSRARTGGMGLGLSICKNLVEAMNGAIEFSSQPGEGTEFRISLPLSAK